MEADASWHAPVVQQSRVKPYEEGERDGPTCAQIPLDRATSARVVGHTKRRHALACDTRGAATLTVTICGRATGKVEVTGTVADQVEFWTEGIPRIGGADPIRRLTM